MMSFTAVRGAVKQSTKLHCGLVRKTIEAIYTRFVESAKIGEYVVDEADVVSYLISFLCQIVVEIFDILEISNEFATVIKDTRAVSKRKLTTTERDLIDSIMSQEDRIGLPDDTHSERYDVALQLVKAGILARVGAHLEFAAPLLRTVFLERLHKSAYTTNSLPGFESFIEECIKRMDPVILKQYNMDAGMCMCCTCIVNV